MPAARASTGFVGHSNGSVSAGDCLVAGARSIRANWPLIGVRWLQIAVTAGLTVAGVVPLAAVLGFERVRSWIPEILAELQRRLEDLAAGAALPAFSWEPVSVPALLAALVVLLGLWTLALFAYCWLQAGFYAVLVAARRATGGEAGDRASIAVFSWRRVWVEGRRLQWRFLGLLQIYLGYILLACLLATLLTSVGLVALGGEGFAVALAASCLTLTLNLAAFALFTLWFGLAQADLAWPDSSVRAAHRRGFAVLARRPGTVLALALVFAVLGVLGGTASLPLQLWLATQLGESALLRGGLRLAVEGAQWVIWGLLLTFFAACFVHLVGSERHAVGAAP